MANLQEYLKAKRRNCEHLWKLLKVFEKGELVKYKCIKCGKIVDLENVIDEDKNQE